MSAHLFLLLITLNIIIKLDATPIAATDNINNAETSSNANAKIADFPTNQNLFRTGDASVREGACGARFLPAAMIQNITDFCINLVGFRMANFPPRQEDLIKINYDDMCFSKCYLTQLKYVNNSDNFNTTAIMEEIRRETPHEKLPGRLRSTQKCIKYTENMAKDEGGVSNSICKYSLVFFVCQRDEEQKMVC